MDVFLVFVVSFISAASGQIHGPVFLLEPPSHLIFSNTSGSQVSCSAHGSPAPQVDWLLQDGQTVTAVPGLRQTLGNGTLYFPPFRAEDYRKDLHSTVYRCRASNLAGTILSRDVNVRAVVNEHYSVQVYHAHVLTGNTAVLGCVIPSAVREYVTVTSWSKDDSILLPGSNMGGRMIVTYGSGELHIRNARIEDGHSRYSCLTLHTLTQERKRSDPATLTVTEPNGNMPPRLDASIQTVASAERETDVHLLCSAQGHPPPIFTWYHEIVGTLQPVYSSVRYELLQDVLLIRKAREEDSGKWTCKASNHLGEQTLDVHLTVTAHLTVHVLPQHQVVNSGESAIFNCTVSGSPIGVVHWLRDGERLAMEGNDKTKLLSPLVLVVARVTRHDRGMYQCVVRNDRESAQGSAELLLGDTVPELQHTFIQQEMQPGPQISLKCAATGSPPPQFRWLLDGEVISEFSSGHRYKLGQFVDRVGDVITHLNITNVAVEDGGLYTCRAINSLGSVEHSARLNIYGPPFIRSIGPIKAVAETEITLHCPYSGYPVEKVRWQRYSQELPADLRHRLDKDGSLTIAHLDPADSGYYTCIVSNKDGKAARREIQLIVNSPPKLEPFVFPSNLQEGARAQATCYVTSGDIPIHFKWYKDRAPIPGFLQIEETVSEFYSMLIFKEVSSRHSGEYTCVASNAAARTNYSATLMVKMAPQWIIEPQDVSALLGFDVLMDCAASGFPKPQVVWLRGRGKTAGDYQPMLSSRRTALLSNGSVWIRNISPPDEGYYLCRATNGIGSGLSKVIYVGVNEPARFEVPSKNISTKRGNPATLHCRVYGDKPIVVRWSQNGNKLDVKDFRFALQEMELENGFSNELTILQTDRMDTGLYKCLAENPFGRSEYAVNLLIQERPDAPSSFEVVEISSRVVRVAWNVPFDGNSPILRYLIQYRVLGNGLDWEHPGTHNISVPALPQASGRRETAMIKSLQPSTAYKVRMLAVNAIAESPFTEELVMKTQEEAPSEPPRGVKVDSVGPEDIFVSWQIPPTHSWNGHLLGYVVEWVEVGNPRNESKSVIVSGWATNKVQITGLRKFTKYEIWVTAFNNVSEGPPSAPILAITKEGLPEAAPHQIACSQTSSQSMKVSWKPPPQEFHGGNLLGYKVSYRPISIHRDNLSVNGEVKRTTSTDTYLHGLYKFTNYSVRVLTFTAAGDGPFSSPIFCSTEEDVPGPPARVKAAAASGDAVMVSWLPPLFPNGRIIHYTVYVREEDRAGLHGTFIVRTDDSVESYGFSYEVRNLVEQQPYQFWVSATTAIGEGERTPMASQKPTSRAPSKIISFSQQVYKAVKSAVTLPCVGVGNPQPRTLWIHQGRPVTFSSYYEVTAEGHLRIFSVDQFLADNYTCSAKNLYGEDNITYSLNVLMPPSAPTVDLDYTTTNSIRIRWTAPNDGGSVIQGYYLSVKRDVDEWVFLELTAEETAHVLEDLFCGAVYYIYVLAYNRVGKGNPSTILTVNTKGGPPQLPKEKDLIVSNATAVQLNLYNWPDGGCPITQFSIKYRPLNDPMWLFVSNGVTGERLIIQELTPATWYVLKISAANDAGVSDGLFNFATTTLSGDIILPPPSMIDDLQPNDTFSYLDFYVLVPGGALIVLFVILLMLWITIIRMKRRNTDERQNDETPQDEKDMELEVRGNKQQPYTASPYKIDTRQNDSTENYEISPYATFNVPPLKSRSVSATTLDFNIQFKTFKHIEGSQATAFIYPKPKHTLPKQREAVRYCNEAAVNPRHTPRHVIPGPSHPSQRPPGRASRRLDSDTDTSSPRDSQYRLPVKSSVGTSTCADTLPLGEVYSSTESNEQSPVEERRRTPRHLVVTYKPSTTSSSEEEVRPEAGMCLQPPTKFSDHSGAECDQDGASSESLCAELATIIERYHEKKELERKEHTINV